jgi:hypothetical protein
MCVFWLERLTNVNPMEVNHLILSDSILVARGVTRTGTSAQCKSRRFVGSGQISMVGL